MTSTLQDWSLLTVSKTSTIGWVHVLFKISIRNSTMGTCKIQVIVSEESSTAAGFHELIEWCTNAIETHMLFILNMPTTRISSKGLGDNISCTQV